MATGDGRGHPVARTPCVDMRRRLRSPHKLDRVAQAAFNELVGMEESQRKHGHDEREIFAVHVHYPEGYTQVVPLVREACADASPGERAFRIAL